MHNFRDNEAFLQTGNDVMVISPLSGVVHNFQWSILKRWPRVHNHVLFYRHILPIFNRLFNFFIFVGISLRPANFVGFTGKMTLPKSWNFEKHLLKGHFLTTNRIFWAIVRVMRLRVWAVRAWLRKTKQKNIKTNVRDRRMSVHLTEINCSITFVGRLSYISCATACMHRSRRLRLLMFDLQLDNSFLLCNINIFTISPVWWQWKYLCFAMDRGF